MKPSTKQTIFGICAIAASAAFADATNLETGMVFLDLWQLFASGALGIFGIKIAYEGLSSRY